MISNFGDIRDQVVVRLGISTTAAASAGYTDAILNNWVNSAYKWAVGYHTWPFTEGRVSTTYSTTEEWSFEGYKADSFRLVQVGGKRLQKLNFEDYQMFREEESSSNDRVFSDFGRLVFINPNIDASGTLTAWGQFVPKDIDVTDLTEKTVFTDGDEDANEAIVEETLSYANTREKKEKESVFHHQRAMQILDGVWKRYNDEQFNYQTKNRGMWKRVDILKGDLYDDTFRRDQF